MFKRMIPLASAALLLFSCGGNKVTAINIDNLVDPDKGSNFLASEKTEMKKGQNIKFSCSFEKFEKEHIYYSISTFAIGNADEISGLTPVEAIGNVKSVTYNGKKLECVNSDPTKKEVVVEWFNKIGEKDPKVNDTYALYNLPVSDPGVGVLLINHYDAKSTDKCSATITISQDVNCCATLANTPNM